MMKVLLFSLLLIFSCQADMYIQCIRGSNNRLDEANRERTNGKRLFNSQNNDRGGYNVGKLNFFEEETVDFCFNVQHGCNNPGMKGCEVVIQIMTDPLIRDGTTTKTIPTNPANCRNFNCDTDPKYGRHESFEYYKNCEKTERNKGLFTASQNLNKDSATRTRQNPGGTRRGLECEEERDYYPSWHASPWIDLAVFTNNPERCAEYQKHSQNVESRWQCKLPADLLKYYNGQIPITEAGCQNVKMLKSVIDTKKKADAAKNRAAGRRNLEAGLTNNTTTEKPVPIDLYLRATWTEIAAHNFPPPECIPGEESRENHLGLIGQNELWTWKWKIPKDFVGSLAEQKYIIRARYNITEDYAAWESASSVQAGADASMNGGKKNKKPNANNDPARLPIWEKYGLTDAEFDRQQGNGADKTRDYILVNNPKVAPLGYTTPGGFNLRLQLAVNTAQYGRTFQDRTHIFYVKKKPAEFADKNIQLVTVQGKRGNIVQTFPGTEYFMVPNIAHIKLGDAVHFAWAGSNTNPNNNDGQGKQGTDRTNIVALKQPNYDGAATPIEGGITPAGALLNNYPAFVKQPVGYELPNPAVFRGCTKPDVVAEPMAGFDRNVVAQLATGRRVHEESLDMGNMEELDDAAASFDLKPVVTKQTGCWSYVSTRNNNFSNRSQKGVLCVGTGDYQADSAGSTGKTIDAGTGSVSFAAGDLTQNVAVKLQTWKDADSSSYMMKMTPIDMSLALKSDRDMKIGVPFTLHAFHKAVMYHKTDPNDEWKECTAELKVVDGQYVAEHAAHEGGWYIVKEEVDAGSVIAIIIGSLVLLGVVGYICWRKNKTLTTEKDIDGWGDQGAELPASPRSPVSRI